MSVHRRLSALFFADIGGYSGLSARDEARALRLVPVFQAATRDVVGRYGAIGAAGALLVRFEEESGRGMPESAAPILTIHRISERTRWPEKPAR
jgi:hypothetical protein